jgi:iron-sulfur cluster repair protein YtfE (RIC family)
MAENSILNLMVAHHALLNALFVLFRDQAKEKSPKTAASLTELKWETKKHFFVEESVIFDFVIMENYGVLATINQLKDEHVTMLNDLEGFSENIDQITSKDLENFYNFLESHREIEEKELYPKLDKELSEEQKSQIIARINEVPLTK